MKVLLAKVLLFDDAKEAMNLIQNLDGNIELAESIRTLAELLNRGRNSFADSEANDKYLSAVEDIKRRDFDSALEKFINIIRTDRSYDDDGARKACIAIFKFLGEEHEITLKHRRDLGSALYV